MDKFTLKKWIQIKILALIVLVVSSVILFARNPTYDLSALNKALAYVATLLAGFSLTIGPLSRRFVSLGKYLTYRRQLGVVAFAYAALHVIISLFFLPGRFPFKWYLDEKIPVIFGILAIGIWIYLVFISRDKKITSLGGKTWVRRQQLGGHIAFLAIYLHLIILKYSFWILWIQGKTKPAANALFPQLPAVNFLVFLIMSMIILYRFVLLIKLKLKK
jgi:DMSO/TMAO reductase YedYZ heme-binding membrane subunit